MSTREEILGCLAILAFPLLTVFAGWCLNKAAGAQTRKEAEGRK